MTDQTDARAVNAREEEERRPIVIRVTAGELALLVEALDSHEYWQLTDPKDRNNGVSLIPDENAGAELRLCRSLYMRLEAMRRR